jgi:hypothetical protein
LRRVGWPVLTVLLLVWLLILLLVLLRLLLVLLRLLLVLLRLPRRPIIVARLLGLRRAR